MKNQSFFESNYKQFGLYVVGDSDADFLNKEQFKTYIKILYLPAGYVLKVDFNEYTTVSPTLFFVNANQYLHLISSGTEKAYFMYYNRDFYCVQIHDAEVACDGLLFNNIYNMPMIQLPNDEVSNIDNVCRLIQEEFLLNDSSQEEMLRVYLKQLIIRSTRIWKKQQLEQVVDSPSEVDFFRNFSRLVEIHYKEKHSVADYADLLGIAPKTLTHKFKRLHLAQPNEIIKDRIILEAKRLLTYTTMSAKEIAYHLGYEDPAYFSRIFTQKVGDTTGEFKHKYLSGKNVQEL